VLAWALATALAADPVAEAPSREHVGKRTFAAVVGPGRARVGAWTLVVSRSGEGWAVDHHLRMRLGEAELSLACADRLADDLTVLESACDDHLPRAPATTRTSRVRGRKLAVTQVRDGRTRTATLRVDRPVRFGVSDAILIAERLGAGAPLSIPVAELAWKPTAESPTWTPTTLDRLAPGAGCPGVPGGTTWRSTGLDLELCLDDRGALAELGMLSRPLRFVLCRDPGCTIPSGRSAEEEAVLADLGPLLRQLVGPSGRGDLVDAPPDAIDRARGLLGLHPEDTDAMLPAILGMVEIRFYGDTARVGVEPGRELVLRRRDGHWRLVDAVVPPEPDQ
jgi:hypothetical protein